MHCISKFVCVCLLIGLSACYYDTRESLYPLSDAACDPVDVRFQQDIVPILQAHCTVCHNPGDPQGGVDLEGHSQVRLYANNGSLYGSIIHDPAYAPMPNAAQKIPNCDIIRIQTWIEGGANND